MMKGCDLLRRLGRLTIGVCAAALCASSAASAADSVLNGQTIRILAVGDPVFQAMQKMHDAMEKASGGKIQLEVLPFDAVHQQVLLNAQNATSNYDIISVEASQFGEYKPAIMDLAPLVKEGGLDVSDFQEGAWAGAQFQGRQLGIPIQPHPEILAYRKDLFAEAGLKPPESTDDVVAAAKKLQNFKPGLSGICWNAARGTPLGQTFLFVMGDFHQPPIDLAKKGNGFDVDDIKPANMKPMIDSAAGRATATYLKTLMAYSPPGILDMAWDERVRVFSQGGCGMTYIWSGRSAIYELDPNSVARGKVGYVPHPHGPGEPTVSPLGGWSLAIPANIDKSRVALAWKVIQWLTDKEMLVEYTKNGDCVSPRHSVSADPDVVGRCPVIPVVDAMSKNGVFVPWERPPVPELQQIVDTLGTEMHTMIDGKTTPDQATASAQKSLDQMMRQAGYY
jgi:multiple sugar transport system substrate-binding protein